MAHASRRRAPRGRTRRLLVSRLPAPVRWLLAKLFLWRGPEHGEIELSHRRIFIMPSRSGLFLGLVLALLLLTSLNYALGLGFALTFWITAIAAMSTFHTYRNLAELRLRPLHAGRAFAGEPVEFTLSLVNGSLRHRHAIRVHVEGEPALAMVDVAPGTELTLPVALPTIRRGLMPVPRLVLRTSFPLGVWRAWSYWHSDLAAIVHPAPEPDPPPVPLRGAEPGDSGAPGPGQDDFAAIRPYRQGDHPRHIAWKVMARQPGDGLLTKQFEGHAGAQHEFDLADLPGSLDFEHRLSRLTAWILSAEQAGESYGLRLGSLRIEPGHGPAHRERCLDALALAKPDGLQA